MLSPPELLKKNYTYLIPGWGWEMEDGAAWFYWVGGS